MSHPGRATQATLQAGARGPRRGARRGALTDDGEPLRVPVTAETVEVTKKPRIVEEIEIPKRPVTKRQTVREAVRREEADVDQVGDLVMDEGARDLVDAGATESRGPTSTTSRT